MAAPTAVGWDPMRNINQNMMGNMASWGQGFAPSAMAGYVPNSFSLDPGLNSFAPNAAGFGQPALAAAGGGSWFDNILTKKHTDGSVTMGWGNALLDLGQAGMQGYLGLQQLDMAKDNLAFQKDSFSKQFENQRTLTNTQMQDRQNARVASNPGAYSSTDEYMKNHGV